MTFVIGTGEIKRGNDKKQPAPEPGEVGKE